jgi:hypothetical protein
VDDHVALMAVLESRSIPEPNSGCWLWLGKLTKDGYASVGRSVNGRYHVTAHRVSYELNVGPIPDGLQLDHLCRVRCCINPDHLEAVTSLVNNVRSLAFRRGVDADPSKCMRGHVLEGANLRLVTYEDGWQRRICLECKTRRNRARSAKNRSAPD